MQKQSRKVRRILICLTLIAPLLLTACTGSGVPIQTQTQITLPPASVPYIAPIGDAALEYVDSATLYLPRRGGTRLVSRMEDVTYSVARLDAESVIRALFNHAGDATVTGLGGDVKLSLYGTNPVEISGDVATVNLAASALQLDRKALYLCGQAIANTLTEFSEIRYVNLLVMDKHIGLDLASTLPMGAFSRSMTDDVAAVYDQTVAQRVQAGADTTAQRLSTTVSLYFPLSAVNGIIAEARNITFTSQQPVAMATRLLEELSEGPVSNEGSPALPLLAAMLTKPPEVVEPSGGAGKIITLHFDATMDDMLTTTGVSRASVLAGICYSLTTFLPNVTGVVVYIGEERIEHVMLGATDGILFDNGVERRTNFAPLLMDQCTLYFSDEQSQRLVEVQRPIPYYMRTQPRALLLELFKGPGAADSSKDTQPVLPSALMGDADILGLSLSEQTLLINFSTRFAQVGETLTSQQNRLLAYAIVNTLLCGERAKRVCFFVGGTIPIDFSSEIDWSGLFYKNLGLARGDT